MSTQNASAEKLPEGYAVATVEWQGYTYELTYYRGFVGRAAIQPDGVTTLEFPIEQSVYHVPQPDPPVSPKAGPNGHSWVKLKGGPNHRAVKFQVDNTPNSHEQSYKGPLAGFTVKLNHPGAAAAAAAADAATHSSAATGNGAGVTITEGADQVANVDVRFQPTSVHFKGIAGAARAFDGGSPISGGGGDETIIVDDHAQSCPPAC
jgi:hypothetical protein